MRRGSMGLMVDGGEAGEGSRGASASQNGARLLCVCLCHPALSVGAFRKYFL